MALDACADCQLEKQTNRWMEMEGGGTHEGGWRWRGVHMKVEMEGLGGYT